MLACQVANAKIIVELMKNGASPFLKDQLGRMAQDYFTIPENERNSQQAQIPKLIEKAKFQWLQQVTQKQLDEKQPKDEEHFQEWRDAFKPAKVKPHKPSKKGAPISISAKPTSETDNDEMAEDGLTKMITA